MPKVSEEYKQKKRQAILESAIKCFGEKGYQATTIDDIVKDSKMSKGTVYNYFKSKEELYLTLFQQSANFSLEFLKDEMAQKVSPEEKLINLFHTYSDVDMHDEEWMKMQRVQGEFWSNASRNEELANVLKDHSKQYVNFISSIIKDCKDQAGIEEEIDSDILAEIFLSLADGMTTHLLVLQDLYPYKELYDLAESMFKSYISRK